MDSGVYSTIIVGSLTYILQHLVQYGLPPQSALFRFGLISRSVSSSSELLWVLGSSNMNFQLLQRQLYTKLGSENDMRCRWPTGTGLSLE